MSMNLMIVSETVRDTTADWAAITDIAKDGLAFIDDATVYAIAKVLDGVTLTNGEPVAAYPWDEHYPSFVSSFGPSLLPEEVLAQLYDILADKPQAFAMLTLIVERGLQVSFNGKEHCDAYIKGVNWPADEVEINRTSGNMYNMLDLLGIEFDSKAESGECTFEQFEEGVARFGWATDMNEKLLRFIQYGKRNNAISVYWA